MDVKAPLERDLYERCCGVAVNLAQLGESIRLIGASGITHQFRMTVVPGLHSAAEVRRWVSALPGGSSLKLQNYQPRSVLAPERVGSRGFTDEEFSAFQLILARGGDEPKATRI
jgi:pyruvate-formate lyase-activating enzyme